MPRSLFPRLTLTLWLAAALSACGGGSGGDGGGGPPPPPPPPSANADLGSLGLTGADLEQAFDPDRTSYTAVVGFLIDSVEVTAAPADEAATLRIDGTVTDGSPVAVALAEGDNDIVLEVTAEDDTTRTYTVTVTRQSAAAFAHDAYIKASNTDAGDLFGNRVALSGDTLAVGAALEDSNATGIGGNQDDNSANDAGAVYVFTRNDGTWTQQAYIKGSNSDAGDFFGIRLALAGDTLAVGAPFEDSAATGIGGNQDDDSAESAGAVYVFTRDNAGAWTQQAYLKPSTSDAGDRFGSSLALAGDTLAVGAPLEDGAATGIGSNEADNNASGAGAVYVFTRDGAGAWSQQAYVKASNTDAVDQFGSEVALSGDTLVVSATREDSAATGIGGDQDDNGAPDAGAVYVFTRDGAEAWSQQAYIKASNAETVDAFGFSLALAGDTLAVGANFEDSVATGVDGNEDDNSASNAGAVYVFTRDGAGAWSQKAYIKASNTDAEDQFGAYLALAGNTLAVSAQREDSAATGIGGDQDDNSASHSGAVYLFTRDDAGTWSQRAYIKASNSEANDTFGLFPALAGDTLAVGAQGEASAATGVGGDQADNGAFSAGAVYVFGGVPSRDADLSALALAGHELDQIFQPSQTAYSADVGFLVSSVHIDAPGADPGAVVRINGVRVGAAGTELPLVEGDNTIEIEVIAEDGVTTVLYTLTVTRQTSAEFAQAAYVKASNTDGADQFGGSVALAGDTLAVGARFEDSAATGVGGDQDNEGVGFAGAVYVFTRDAAGVWSQQAYIKASNTDADVVGDNFGTSVALAGDTLAVGAPFESSAATGIGGDQDDVSASGAGAVYVFTRDAAGVWSQQAYIKASNTDAGDEFGTSVALAGDTLAVGARREDSAGTGVGGDQDDDSIPNAGAVYVFTRDAAGVWSQQAYVKASNTDSGEQFGTSVALAGDTLVVGVPLEDSAATGIGGDQDDDSLVLAGAVYVFARDAAGAWSQQAYIKASNTDALDEFGTSVALSGDTLAVGAPREASAAAGIGGGQGDNTAAGAGAVYVFTRGAAGAWSQQTYIKASNTAAGDEFGTSVALAGDTLIVGAAFEDSAAAGIGGDQDNNSAGSAGAVYAFTRDAAGAWSQQAYIKASNTDSLDAFGTSVALAGGTLAVGAIAESSAATGIDGAQEDNSLNDSGAVYVFK